MISSFVPDDVLAFSSFELVRRKRQGDKYVARLEKPLAYWVLPSDRGLPRIFLDKPLNELIGTPFRVLSATPGVGTKKISNLVRLLQRAAEDDPGYDFESTKFSVPKSATHTLELKAAMDNVVVDRAMEQELSRNFNADRISPSLWETWIATVQASGVGAEPLGKVTRSLGDLPNVMWTTPLSFYMSKSLDEIRNLRGLGKKKVSAILEIVFELQRVLKSMPLEDVSSVELKAPSISKIEVYIAQINSNSLVPSREDLIENIASPLLEQIILDTGEIEHRIAMLRSGIKGPVASIRSIARSVNVSRARIYQLLETISMVMSVRWPEGKPLLSELRNEFSYANPDGPEAVLMSSLVTLFYPENRDLESDID